MGESEVESSKIGTREAKWGMELKASVVTETETETKPPPTLQSETDPVKALRSEPDQIQAGTKTEVKWKAAYKVITGTPTEKLWEVAEDYCNLDWCSLVTECVMLEGEGAGDTEGTVRRCTANQVPERSWFSDEKLVAIDHEKMTLTYEMVKSSLGWNNYRATLSVGKEDQDGMNFVQLEGAQSPRDGVTEEENVKFMTLGYNVFVTDLVSKASTL